MRRLPNFIDSFVEYGSVFSAPDRYLRWGGAFVVSSLVTRAVGLRVRGNTLAPNLFCMMVGGPSVGKSQTIKAIKSVLQRSTNFTFVPKSLTRAGMQDFMAANLKQRIGLEGAPTMSSEFIGVADKLQGLLPDQDLGHLTLFNELYDLPNIYTAVTRSHGEVRLEYPYASLFVGAQPQFLQLTMPEGAWGMGFMSRTIMVFGVAKARKSAFEDTDVDYALLEALIHDAKQIFNLQGFMKFTKQAMALYEEWWVVNGGLPIPGAKRLAMGYNGRRELNMLKLAMTMSLSRSNDLIVEEEDVASAIGLLLEAEQQMQYIFNEMAATGSMIAIEDVLDRVRHNSLAGKDTTEAELIELLMTRFPSTQVNSIIDNLVQSKALKKLQTPIDARGFRKFTAGDQVARI